MMKINIFQINLDRDKNRVAFERHERLSLFQGSSNIDSEIYDKVYECHLPCSNLEDVYTIFNISHPEDYRGRSLSVSDIVEVVESKDVKPGFYFCDSFGFKEVDFLAHRVPGNKIPLESQIQTAKNQEEIKENKNTQARTGR